MTGTIKRLDLANASGVITASDGQIVGFLPSAVLAYDVPILAVGQVVSFDLEDGRHPHAVNVSVQRAPQSLNGPEKHPEVTRLRFMGFQQERGVRSYRFEMAVPEGQKATFIVHADIALFTKHHVGIQEGPSLCLRLLASKPDGASTSGGTAFEYSLTDRELLAYLASRPVPRVRHGPRSTSHATAETPHAV